MANDYTSRWFQTFLEPMPPQWTQLEVAGVRSRLPRPAFTRILDVCCGPGRHAAPLAAEGYDITGVDRDRAAIAHARRTVPTARFVQLDVRELAQLQGPFDAALVLWQSFGYFSPAMNGAVLRGLASLLRPGGRLLLDVFHPAHVQARQGIRTDVRGRGCASITNTVAGGRLTSTIRYLDGAVEVMDFELFSPDELSARAATAGFRTVEQCCWWDPTRPPTQDEQRYQMVLERR